MAADFRRGSYRLAHAIHQCSLKHRLAGVGDRPGVKFRWPAIEFPQVAVQISGISSVDQAVCVGIDQGRAAQAIGVEVRYCDLLNHGAGLHIEHVQGCHTGRTQIAVRNHRSPLVRVLIDSHDRRPAVAVTEIVGTGTATVKFPQDLAGCCGLRRRRRACDIQRVESFAAGTEAADQHTVPAATELCVLNGEAAIDEVLMAVWLYCQL